MKLPIPTIQKSKAKATVLSLDHQESYIFRLPTELLLEIMTLLWSFAISREERRKLRMCLPFVCRAFAAIFYHVSQQHVTIRSPEFYNNYIELISKLDRSHPMNISCKSLHFYVDRMWDGGQRLPLAEIWAEPLEMGSQRDGFEYFNNGKNFAPKGLFPNLTHIVIDIFGGQADDPYHALFPHFMPRTVETLQVNYVVRRPFLNRATPIRYPSIPHKLKRLTITGIWRNDMVLARIWESLFEVEEFIVDGNILPVGEDVPWSLRLDQAYDMVELGCKGIGWNWVKRRPWQPLDEHFHQVWNYKGTFFPKFLLETLLEWGVWYLRRLSLFLKSPLGFLETLLAWGVWYLRRLFLFSKAQKKGNLNFPQANRPIRRLKSFPHLQGSGFLTATTGVENNTTIMPIRRTKSCAELTTTGYPYGSRVYYYEMVKSLYEYEVHMRNSLTAERIQQGIY